MNKREYDENDITRKVNNFIEDHPKELHEAYNTYKKSLKDKFDKDYYKCLPESALRDELSKASILILTANLVETGTLHSWIVHKDTNKPCSVKRIIKNDMTFYFFDWHKYRVVNVWAGTTGSHTECGSSWTIRKILDEYMPKIVLSLGVAFGNYKSKQELGDVLVSKEIVSYDKGIKLVADRIDIKNKHFFELSPWLAERFRQKKNFFLNDSNNFKIHYGTIVTGEAVVDDQKAIMRIAEAVRCEFIGGEMEGYGIFSECDNRGIPCAVIKGICDWGTGKNALSEDPHTNEEKKDSLQAFAMVNVLTACDVLFSDEMLFEGNVINNTVKHLTFTEILKKSKLFKFIQKCNSFFSVLIGLILIYAGVYFLFETEYLEHSTAMFIGVFLIFSFYVWFFIIIISKYKHILKKVLHILINEKEEF